MTTSQSQFGAYARLMRLNRPIGILLVMWPALWSLWLAAEGVPDIKLLFVFIVGSALMRSAGCVINDFADRKLDGHVQRTRDRPLATGEVTVLEALGLFVCLVFLAFILVLFTNLLTVKLAFVALALAVCYPFAKRFTQLPQVVLGAAFAWAIPMAFAAQSGTVPTAAWLIFVGVLLWTVTYDTFYAMVDREDDLRVGIKSTAVLFGEHDRMITGCLQALTWFTFFLMGQRFGLGNAYHLALVVVAALFAYQQFLIRTRDRAACFKAFMNNNWVGMALWLGIAAHYWMTHLS